MMMEEKMRNLVLMVLSLAALSTLPLPARADGEKAGEFDYYVLSLSWSSTYCTLQGDSEAEDQCDPRHDYSFTLHGLWPQNESGWPSDCVTAEPNPRRSDTAAMEDIMGSDGLAWYEWKKHGRCTGLSAQDYYAASRQAYEKIKIPEEFLNLQKNVNLPASVVEDAFVETNPGLSRSGVTIMCDENMISEVRICLTKDLAFRDCAQDAARDCRMLNALMEAVR